MERIGLKNPSCDCYMNASLHFLCASYYFIHQFCKMFETTNDAVLMSSIYEFLVGCDENRADVFKILMQNKCPEYVPGAQHDPFLFITDVICQLDAEINLRHNGPNYEEAMTKHFAIYTQVSLKCKQGHKRTYIPDPALIMCCPITCDTKTCSLSASFNQMFRKEKIPDYECLSCRDQISTSKLECFESLPNLLMCHVICGSISFDTESKDCRSIFFHR